MLHTCIVPQDKTLASACPDVRDHRHQKRDIAADCGGVGHLTAISRDLRVETPGPWKKGPGEIEIADRMGRLGSLLCWCSLQ